MQANLTGDFWSGSFSEQYSAPSLLSTLTGAQESIGLASLWLSLALWLFTASSAIAAGRLATAPVQETRRVAAIVVNLPMTSTSNALRYFTLHDAFFMTCLMFLSKLSSSFKYPLTK